MWTICRKYATTETRTRSNGTRGAFGIHSRIVAVSSKLALDLMEKMSPPNQRCSLCVAKRMENDICSMFVHLMDFHGFIFRRFPKYESEEIGKSSKSGTFASASLHFCAPKPESTRRRCECLRIRATKKNLFKRISTWFIELSRLYQSPVCLRASSSPRPFRPARIDIWRTYEYTAWDVVWRILDFQFIHCGLVPLLPPVTHPLSRTSNEIRTSTSTRSTCMSLKRSISFAACRTPRTLCIVVGVNKQSNRNEII